MNWLKSFPLAFALSLTVGSGCSDPGNSCKDTAQLFSMTEKSPSGATGQSFVKGILGTHELTLSIPKKVSEKDHKMDPKVSITPIPEGTKAKLHISLVPGADYTYLSSEYVPCKPLRNCPLLGVMCYNRFSIPIRAHLKSEGGQIDELWEGTLIEADPADPRSATISTPENGTNKNSFRLSLARPSSSFQGSFKVSPPNLPAGTHLKDHEVTITAQFSAGKLVKGSIGSRVHTESDSVVGNVFGPVLSLTPSATTHPGGTGTKS